MTNKSIQIDSEIHSKLKVACNNINMEIKALVEDLIDNWLKSQKKRGRMNNGLWGYKD